MSVVLSAAVRQNLLSLQSTAAQLATTQNDLSTGKKVNSALDNPTNFFTASGLDNRAGDISNLLDGISNGVQVLQAANTGITSVESLVSQAKSIASQALQAPLGYSQKASVTSAVIPGATADNLAGGGSTTGGTFTGGQIGEYPTSNPATLNTFLSDVFSIANNSGANPSPGDYLLIDGKTIGFSAGSGTTISASGANLDLSSAKISDLIGAINTVAGSSVASFSNGAISIGSGTSNSGLVVQGRYSFLSVFSLLSGTSSNLSPPVTGIPDDTPPHTSTTLLGTGASLGALGQTLSFGAVGNGTATTITFGDGTNGTVKTLDQLNSRLAADNLAATLDSTGKLTITTTNDAASATIPALGGTAFSSASGAFYNKTASAPVADPTSQATRSTLVAQYNAILTQIDNTAADSSYNGVNLLSGDQLQLTFDETGKSKLSITGVNDSSAGLGLTALVSGTDFIDNNATNTVLTTLNSVSTKLRSQASAFGSNLSVVQTRQDFNTNLINVLQTGSANLTQADINLEAANSQALSTRQSLSVSALSLANQSQQSVLQLLR